MWRKQILGPKKRGPIEFSKVPTVDDSADGDAPVVCVFGDGQKAEVSHLTMDPLLISVHVFLTYVFLCPVFEVSRFSCFFML